MLIIIFLFAEQTASAVIADLVDVARLQPGAAPQYRVPALSFHTHAQQDLPVLPMAEVRTRHYLRMPLQTTDPAAALADMAQLLSRCHVAVQSLQLYTDAAHNQLHALVLTEPARDADAASAAHALQAMPACAGEVVRLRVDMLE